MCGITGIIGDSARDPGLLKRMTGRLAHRGPDDEGLWTDPDIGVGLGNRRLAIIDLSPAGHQPVHSSTGRFVLTFNGEIYNHRELRSELESRGAVPEGGWRGHSDTETLIEAIAQLGLAATLDRCVGMFAFALWDRQERRLRLVRDRFGEKPLYYGWAGKDFVFASELKAIRSHPAFEGAIDRRALRLFAARTYVPAPLSIYRGVFKLEPACILELTAESARLPISDPPPIGFRAAGLSMSRYWFYQHVVRAGLENPIDDEAEALEQLEYVLARAIHGQSIADVPVGAFLSGGIDSSTVVALYQKYSTLPIRTFTIGFEEQAFNEAEHSRGVAKHLGTDHHERIVTPHEARDVIPKLPQTYDEPFADSSQIPTYLVSAFARERVTVALSGDAGDELFGGYNRYFMMARAWAKLQLLPGPVRMAAAKLLSRIPATAWDRFAALVPGMRIPREFGSKARNSMRTFAGARNLDEALTSFLDNWSDDGSPVIGDAETADGFALDLDVRRHAPEPVRMMYCDATTYLPDDILCKVDRASMAVGLEVHVPFLDHRVAEVAARIPLEMKIRGSIGKNVLRRLLYREIPPNLLDRPKTGFGIPIGEWLKGPLRPWAEDLLDRRCMAEQGWFDPEVVQQRWLDHVNGRRDSTAAIWSVLMYQAWLRVW